MAGIGYWLLNNFCKSEGCIYVLWSYGCMDIPSVPVHRIEALDLYAKKKNQAGNF